MRHPSFYLDAAIGRAIDIDAARSRARVAGIVDYSIEASRSRRFRSQRYTVICSPAVAEMLIAEIEQLRTQRDPPPPSTRAAAIAEIRAAIAEASAPLAPMRTGQPSEGA